MKNTVLLPNAAITILLMGCEGMPMIDRIAMVRDVETTGVAIHGDGNKQEVLAKMGQPQSRVPILNGSGECFNYTRVLRGTGYPFYVGFNQRGLVTNAGYDRTCEQAKAQGLLDRLEPKPAK